MSFMQVATHATKNFATLGPSELQPPFTGIWNLKQVIFLNFSYYSTGQTSDPIHHFTILQSPVFLINSRYPLLFNFNYKFQIKILFIPKLQSKFAEFLQNYSFITLVHLYSFTCVGFSTVFSIFVVFSRKFFKFCN